MVVVVSEETRRISVVLGGEMIAQASTRRGCAPCCATSSRGERRDLRDIPAAELARRAGPQTAPGGRRPRDAALRAAG